MTSLAFVERRGFLVDHSSGRIICYERRPHEDPWVHQIDRIRLEDLATFEAANNHHRSVGVVEITAGKARGIKAIFIRHDGRLKPMCAVAHYTRNASLVALDRELEDRNQYIIDAAYEGVYAPWDWPRITGVLYSFQAPLSVLPRQSRR